jgi:L-asparaginase II
MNPVLVEVVRGTAVESRHRGAACVVATDGTVVSSWGDVEAPICPRSALKPLQALALLDTGAADAFDVTDAELALACASHSGEPDHVQRVSAWLSRVGLSEKDLECGTHPVAATSDPGPLHNNCSGKHAGFLCCALHMKAATRGYTAAVHPVQRQVREGLSRITGCDLATAPVVIDGCSAPNWFLPLRHLAQGWARLGGVARIVSAMKTHPFLVAGTERPCTRFIQALKGQGIVKTGAEGVYAAVLPERGLGIAVKIDDGAGRAAGIAMAAILHRLDAFRADMPELAARLRATDITAWAGAHTGVIRATDFIGQ